MGRQCNDCVVYWRVNGWMGRQVSGWVDRWMHEGTHAYSHSCQLGPNDDYLSAYLVPSTGLSTTMNVVFPKHTQHSNVATSFYLHSSPNM